MLILHRYSSKLSERIPMFSRNGSLKHTLLRIMAALVIPFIHFCTLLFWQSLNRSTLPTYTCPTSDHCVPVQVSLWDFYRDASFWDWVWTHLVVMIVAVLIGIFAIAALMLMYFVIIGESPLKNAEEEGTDDFIPCTDAACSCTSHQNEDFTSEWVARG